MTLRKRLVLLICLTIVIGCMVGCAQPTAQFQWAGDTPEKMSKRFGESWNGRHVMRLHKAGHKVGSVSTHVVRIDSPHDERYWIKFHVNKYRVVEYITVEMKYEYANL